MAAERNNNRTTDHGRRQMQMLLQTCLYCRSWPKGYQPNHYSQHNMIHQLTFCICVSLACITIHISITWPNMILSFTQKYLQRLPQVVRKPLYECTICMCSFWTIALYFIIAPAFSFPLREVGVCILITGGLNTLFCIALNQTDYGC